MSKPGRPSGDGPVFRIDRFIVPDDAREEFLAAVRRVHAVLRSQAGFVRELVAEQPDVQGKSSVVTFVEWEGDGDLPGARAVVAASHAAAGFDPAATLARLGIEAQFGVYRPVPKS